MIFEMKEKAKSLVKFDTLERSLSDYGNLVHESPEENFQVLSNASLSIILVYRWNIWRF